MAAITWVDVVGVPGNPGPAPELASVGTAAQELYLALANDFVNVAMFDGEDGGRTKLARVYIAAHFATLDKLRGTSIAGPVISESRGGLSRSYANLTQMSMASGLFGQTTYGQNYATLVRTSRARFPITV